MKTFRQYAELRQAAPSFLDSLERELNIRPQDIEGKGAEWGANLTLGKFTYNGMTYQIAKWERDAQGQVIGAIIKPIDTQRAYVKDGEGRNVRSPDDKEDIGRGFFVKKDELDKLMNQEAGSAPPAGGGGMPPMPGMGG